MSDTPSSAASGMGDYELASASVQPEPSSVEAVAAVTAKEQLLGRLEHYAKSKNALGYYGPGDSFIDQGAIAAIIGLLDALSAKDRELAEARERIHALEWEKNVTIIAARDAVLSAISKSPEEGWRYSINHGPDGEVNFSNVYAPNDAFVGNLKTHHAAMIVAGMNAATTRARDEALSALREKEERVKALEEALTEEREMSAGLAKQCDALSEHIQALESGR